MDKLVIRGGHPLKGNIEVGGSKNCALPVLFATLLSPEKHEIQGVPRLQDMESTLRMLVHLGARVQQFHNRQFGSDWVVDASGIQDRAEAPYDLVRKMRASILCFGPLLARRGYARVSLPGGCAIGARPIDLHLLAFEKMGAVVKQAAGYVEAEIPKELNGRLKGARIIFPLVSVGATENAVMAATLADGLTILENAAREPEIRDLCVALKTMGAKIKGEGTSTIEIEGVKKLGKMNFRIPPDRIEAATYLIGAQMTGGRVRLEGARADDLEFVLEKLEETGAKITRGENFVECQSSDEIKPVDVTTAPYPGFATDVQAQWMALMTQASGDSVISETIFENRFMHVPELIRMGAHLSVNGSSVRTRSSKGLLEGAPVMATDLRASACLVLAALVAKGETQVKRIYHLDRGYESMEVKLRSLGADVERQAE